MDIVNVAFAAMISRKPDDKIDPGVVALRIPLHDLEKLDLVPIFVESLRRFEAIQTRPTNWTEGFAWLTYSMTIEDDDSTRRRSLRTGYATVTIGNYSNMRKGAYLIHIFTEIVDVAKNIFSRG